MQSLEEGVAIAVNADFLITNIGQLVVTIPPSEPARSVGEK
ncbi:MAG: hypothetical protein ACOX4B_07510 [Bacillota bacterium]